MYVRLMLTFMSTHSQLDSHLINALVQLMIVDRLSKLHAIDIRDTRFVKYTCHYVINMYDELYEKSEFIMQSVNMYSKKKESFTIRSRKSTIDINQNFDVTLSESDYDSNENNANDIDDEVLTTMNQNKTIEMSSNEFNDDETHTH